MQVETLKQLLKEGKRLIFIDVRDADEITEQSYFVHSPKNYLNIPILSLLFASKAELEEKIFTRLDIPRSMLIVTLCLSGGRSARACEKLLQYGWKTENLEGGVEAWGQPV